MKYIINTKYYNINSVNYSFTSLHILKKKKNNFEKVEQKAKNFVILRINKLLN